VPKVPAALRAPFWHFWHPAGLGFLENHTPFSVLHSVLAFIVLFGLAFFWSFDLAKLMRFVFMVAADVLGAVGLKVETSVWRQRQVFFHPP
jgi:hypothetical protein